MLGEPGRRCFEERNDRKLGNKGANGAKRVQFYRAGFCTIILHPACMARSLSLENPVCVSQAESHEWMYA